MLISDMYSEDDIVYVTHPIQLIYLHSNYISLQQKFRVEARKEGGVSRSSCCSHEI